MTSSGAPETELELDVLEGTEGDDGDQLPLYLRQAKPGAGEGRLCGCMLGHKASTVASPPGASAWWQVGLPVPVGAPVRGVLPLHLLLCTRPAASTCGR